MSHYSSTEHSETDLVSPLRQTASRSPVHTTRALPSQGGPALDGGASLSRTVTAMSEERGVAIMSMDVRGGFGRVTSRLPNPEGDAANDLLPAAAVAAAAEDAGAKKPQLDKFAYGFFDPQMKMFRGIVFKILGMTVVITILVMWMALPFYWGSLWKSNHYTDKLTVRVIDADAGSLGSYVSTQLLAETNLRYFLTSPSQFPTQAALEQDVVDEGAWAAIVINAGATAALETARQVGNASYAAASAISVYYAQARQETAVNSYLLPDMQQALAQILGTWNAQSAAQYLTANAGNTTAMTLLAQAPDTISQPAFYTLYNLRPYNQPVAQAITLVGLIYMLIFSFIITMTNNACREIIAPFLTTKAYIAYRLLAPLSLYAVISFFFAMVNLPFKVHFDAHFTYAGGFFLWWFAMYLGMAAVGLATEFAITILGPKFVAFFLIPLIIVNVSVASLPHELQPWIYRYGVAMPFYNCSRIVRTIIFNTKNELGRNFGILLGWVGLSLVTISLVTWLMRRKAVNAYHRENSMPYVDREKGSP